MNKILKHLKEYSFTYLVFGTLITAGAAISTKVEIYNPKNERQVELRKIDSIYNIKKDSLENVYQLQLDSLNKNYQTNLKNIEEKFKR
jgi:hypothetical protein